MMAAHFHLPGLFEFYEFYKEFLKLYGNHREYFYDWLEITSIYGAPRDCIWSGGRFEDGDNHAKKVLDLLQRYGIEARLTFSNSLLREEHLSDRKCNKLCKLFEEYSGTAICNGVIVHSDLLLNYLRENYPKLYCVSSTTKVLTDFKDLKNELSRNEFRYVVPDFRLNKQIDKLFALSQQEKDKVEFLCNECCYVGCTERKACYESVSRRNLGEDQESNYESNYENNCCVEFQESSANEYIEHQCKAPGGNEGYRFSKAMANSTFISIQDIQNTYLPAGFSNFKIEGRGLGSAIVLEMLLYYLVKPECHLLVRENIYLDSMLNLF